MGSRRSWHQGIASADRTHSEVSDCSTLTKDAESNWPFPSCGPMNSENARASGRWAAEGMAARASIPPRRPQAGRPEPTTGLRRGVCQASGDQHRRRPRWPCRHESPKMPELVRNTSLCLYVRISRPTHSARSYNQASTQKSCSAISAKRSASECANATEGLR